MKKNIVAIILTICISLGNLGILNSIYNTKAENIIYKAISDNMYISIDESIVVSPGKPDPKFIKDNFEKISCINL